METTPQPLPPPTTNKIPLDKKLVDEFKSFQKNIRTNTIAMAKKAAEIRSEHLLDNGQYDPAFKDWWSGYKLDLIFVSRGNFSKWAAGGDLLLQAKIGKYLDQLPTTLKPLYEVAQLTKAELKHCLQDKYTRTSVLDDEGEGRKKPRPLIHPEVTAGEIRSWRMKWRNPKPKSTERRQLPFANLKVHYSLYDFDKKGSHKGVLTVEKLKEINDALITAMKPFDEYVLLEPKLDSIEKNYQRRQERAESAAAKRIAKTKEEIDRYNKAMERWYWRVQKHLQKQARRIVLEMKRRAMSRFATTSYRLVSKQDRAKAWGFTWDETFIDDNADERRIQEVLDCIGRGDEFDKLREQAYSQIEQPTPPAETAEETTEDRQRSLDELAAYFRKRRRRKKPNLTKFIMK